MTDQEFREKVLVTLTELKCGVEDIQGHLTPQFFEDVNKAKVDSRMAIKITEGSRTLLYSVIVAIIITAVPSFYLLAKEFAK